MKTFKNLNTVGLVITLAVLASCASKPRTKFSDKSMRILIDADSVEPSDYIKIQTALVKTGAFAVIDRAKGFSAIKREQERAHRDQIDRFSDRDKYAHWGRLYSVGAVVVGHAQCHMKQSGWSGQVTYCQQFLNVIDSNTGEVIVAVEGGNDAELGTRPDWDEITDKLVQNYPKYFVSNPKTKELNEYQDESEERAIRQKRELAEEELHSNAAPRKRERAASLDYASSSSYIEPSGKGNYGGLYNGGREDFRK